MAEVVQPLNGRKRRRDNDVDPSTPHQDNATTRNDGSPVLGQKGRRRGRDEHEKRFECTHEGCGKGYSRAEHLHRHQLNREQLNTLVLLPAS